MIDLSAPRFSELSSGASLFRRGGSALAADSIERKRVTLDKETFFFPELIQLIFRKAELKIHYPVADVAGHVVVMIFRVEDPFTAYSIEPSPILEVDAV